MPELNIIDWSIVILAAAFIGISKTGLNNLSILVVTMMVAVFPAKVAMGILLPLLIVGDIIAVLDYRKNVIWRHLIKLVPWVFCGIIIGYFILDYVSDSELQPIIGFIILLLNGLNITKGVSGSKFVEY